MYRREHCDQLLFKDFFLPFGGKLSGDNRSIKLAELIPGDELEDDYAAQLFKGSGALAKQFRMALGALIIKARMGVTDEELVEQINENPYLQFFIDLELTGPPSLVQAFGEWGVVVVMLQLSVELVRSLRKNRLAGRVFPNGELIMLGSGSFSAFQWLRTPDLNRFAPLGLPGGRHLGTPWLPDTSQAGESGDRQLERVTGRRSWW